MKQKTALCVLALDAAAKLKNDAWDVLSYASALADEVQIFCLGGLLEESEIAKLQTHGVHVLVHCKSGVPSDSAAAVALAQYVTKNQLQWVLGAQNLQIQLFFAQLSACTQAQLLPHVVALPDDKDHSLRIRRSVYTGKAFETLMMDPEAPYLMLLHRHIAPPYAGQATQLKRITFEAEWTKPLPNDRIKVKEVHRVAQKKVPLPEARIVVSGGRGMKGAEHWHLIEQLADALGAATACSKPVSDMEWRPHHEHVGQTGLKISPELYIAVGISGAVQHLAGVHASKVIVVINTDPDAPFFQAADYGIQGDAFDVLPKLIQGILQLNQSPQ